jgi:hypothetical protein
MRLLLNTHAFLWFILDEPQLSATARALIADPSNEIDVSPATYWEIAIKIRLEKYILPEPFQEFMEREIAINENDWLLDIRPYSRNFRADRASILLDELGLGNQHLRQHLADRRKFFDNKDRVQKLKSLVSAEDTALDLDRKGASASMRATSSYSQMGMCWVTE